MMIQVHERLFVGNESDFAHIAGALDSWSVVHACKEPFRRQFVGYAGKAAPKTHPEYLSARRGERLALNLIDPPTAAFVPPQVMDEAVAFIHERLSAGQRVLVHCNQGQSRSPAIAMLYLATHTDRLPRDSFDAALRTFKEVYPPLFPGPGILEFLRTRWLLGFSAAGN